MKNQKSLLGTSLLALLLTYTLGFSTAKAAEPVREWTFLVFMNGHNNLDSYTDMDINEMEQVGSTDKVNVVVQWAASSNKDTRRLFVKKDNDPKKVTSPVVQSLPRVDMGDYNELTNFVKWGAQNYPAKHYFVVGWNHGSGWHDLMKENNWNISYDDFSGHSITTLQLGQSMADAAKAIGQKIDIYGSDACMMNMIEVGQEISPSVNFMVGSEETEPMPGWPYDGLLKSMNALSDMSPANVAKALPPAYVESYSGGTQGTEETVSSALDLSQFPALLASLSQLRTEMVASTSSVKPIQTALADTQKFYYSDYVDAGDFLTKLSANMSNDDRSAATIASVQASLKNAVIAVNATPNYKASQGLSIWFPDSKYSYTDKADAYKALSFDMATQWHAMIESVLQ